MVYDAAAASMDTDDFVVVTYHDGTSNLNSNSSGIGNDC